MLDIQASAIFLGDRQQAGACGARLPEEMQPKTCWQAWDIQQATSEYLRLTTGATIAGWKCGLPSADKIIIAPIYSDSVFYYRDRPSCRIFPRQLKAAGPAELSRPVAAIEPEFAFVFRQSLMDQPDAYTPEEIDRAVDCHMALELIADRFLEPHNATYPELLADRLFNQGLFLGPRVPASTASLNLHLSYATSHADTSCADTHQTYAGAHANGEPKAPLYWLVNFLRTQGIVLSAGQIVITGSLAGVWEVPLATPIHIAYENCGEFTLDFTPR